MQFLFTMKSSLGNDFFLFENIVHLGGNCYKNKEKQKLILL